MKKRLERRIGRQRKGKESQMDKRRKTEKRMHKGRKVRENDEGKKWERKSRGKDSTWQPQCKYTSKHCCQRWDQLVNAEERSGSRRWLKNLTCISGTHANAPVQLNKPQIRKVKGKRKDVYLLCTVCRMKLWQFKQSNQIRHIMWTFDEHHLNALFKVVSASHAARLIGLFSFGSNSLNMAEMRKKSWWVR